MNRDKIRRFLDKPAPVIFHMTKIQFLVTILLIYAIAYIIAYHIFAD